MGKLPRHEYAPLHHNGADFRGDEGNLNSLS